MVHAVGAELFHADGETGGQAGGRTEIAKIIVVFAIFRMRL